jgi:hypothetical protein
MGVFRRYFAHFLGAVVTTALLILIVRHYVEHVEIVPLSKARITGHWIQHDHSLKYHDIYFRSDGNAELKPASANGNVTNDGDKTEIAAWDMKTSDIIKIGKNVCHINPISHSQRLILHDCDLSGEYVRRSDDNSGGQLPTGSPR